MSKGDCLIACHSTYSFKNLSLPVNILNHPESVTLEDNIETFYRNLPTTALTLHIRSVFDLFNV